MRTFSGLRRPMGGFLLDEPGARATSDREAEKRFEQQAEAAKVFDDKFGHMVTQLNRRMEMMMRTMAEVLDLVSQQKTKIDSLNTLMDGVRAEVQRLLTNSNTDQTTQALVDQVFDRLTENSGALDAAIAENIDSGKEAEQKKDAGIDGKSSEEILKQNDEKKAEEIGKATTNPEPTGTNDTVFGQPAVNTSDTSGDAGGAGGGGPNAGSYNQVTGQFDTAGRPPVINPATGQPVPGIVGGAPPSDTGNKDLSMPADVGSLGQQGDPATSPAMQQGLSGTGGASNASDPNTGHQANVASSDAPEPPVAKDNAIGDQPLKDPNRPVV